jgi:PPM family protein phosphatase
MQIQLNVQEARAGRGEDRCRVVQLADESLLVAVADGAGGVTGGAAAADAVCQIASSTDWRTWLKYLDRSTTSRRAADKTHPIGLAAAVVLEISHGVVQGTSVGDCEAWIFNKQEVRSLTCDQIRKPLLGDGDAKLVAFKETLKKGDTLVVATDGLWKYTTIECVAAAVSLHDVLTLPSVLIGLVRLPSQRLQDDVAIVAVRL